MLKMFYNSLTPETLSTCLGNNTCIDLSVCSCSEGVIDDTEQLQMYSDHY